MEEFADAIQYDSEGNATLTVGNTTEEITESYLSRFISKNVCSLTWHNFSEEQWFSILDLIAKNTSIATLQLEHGTITNAVSARLVAIPHITSLCVETMDIEPAAVATLATTKTIETLELIRFDNLPFESLAPFGNNTSITTLYIADMGDIDYRGLTALLSANKTLKYLKLRNLDFTEEALAAIFSNDLHHAVTHVMLEQDVTERGMLAIVANNRMTELDLGFYALSKEAGEALATAPFLTSIKLLNMEVKDDLVALLCGNPNITSLALPQNPISNKSAEVLANNTRLTKLDISYSKINHTGLQHFLTSESLQELVLARSENELPKAMQTVYRKLQTQMEKNKAISE